MSNDACDLTSSPRRRLAPHNNNSTGRLQAAHTHSNDLNVRVLQNGLSSAQTDKIKSEGTRNTTSEESPLLRKNPKTPLIRSRSSDKNVFKLIPVSFEKAQRRSSYSGSIAIKQQQHHQHHQQQHPTQNHQPHQYISRERRPMSSGARPMPSGVLDPSLVRAWPSVERSHSADNQNTATIRRVRRSSEGPKPVTSFEGGFDADFSNCTEAAFQHQQQQLNSSCSSLQSSNGSHASRDLVAPSTPLPVLSTSSRDTPSRRTRSSQRSPTMNTPQHHSKQHRRRSSSTECETTPSSNTRRESFSNEISSTKTSPNAIKHQMDFGPRAKSEDRVPSRPNIPPLSVSSSSSSHDEQHPRRARRSRRPVGGKNAQATRKPREHSQFDSADDDQNGMTSEQDITDFLEKPKRQATTEYLNHSFQLSMSMMDAITSSPTRDRIMDENEIATPSMAKKFSTPSMPKFTIPQTPVKKPRRRVVSSGNSNDTSSEGVLKPLDEEESVTSTLVDVPITGKVLYECARRCEWDRIATECSENPWTAKYVCDQEGTTVLHLAVISRTNPLMRDGAVGGLLPAPLSLIEQLMIASPEAAITRCTAKRYTPLSYASLVVDNEYDMDDSASMIQIILKHNPHSALIFTDDGFSAIDVHIISYSRLHQEKAEVYSSTGRSSTVVLCALLDANPSLALARSYGNRVRGPVELLYRCNLNEFKEASGADIAQSNKHRSRAKVHKSSVVSTLSDWWAWKWALLLLKVSSILEEDDDDDLAPFSAVHAAAHLVGCPIPLLSLAIDAFPELARTRNPRKGLNNCALHEVCSWVTDDLVVNGDPFVVKRKRKAIAMLLEAFPKAARMTNSQGETPLQLAIETCTSWDSLDKLIKAFPKTLTIPRNLEHLDDESPLFKAVAYHNDDVGSVGSDEEEWDTEAIDAVEGMYPFMVAGVLSHIPERRNYTETLLCTEQDRRDNKKNLENKNIESLRSIYGLLRAQPNALALFIEDERKRQEEEQHKPPTPERESDLTEAGDETEPYVEETESYADNEEIETVIEEIIQDDDECHVEDEYTDEELEISVASSEYEEITCADESTIHQPTQVNR